jgi:hypothetical protein
MKIHQLPMNARFEYEGQEYVKTGPQLAAGSAGQRLIQKYAVLKVLDPASVAPDRKASALSTESVRQSFAVFYSCCETLVPADRQFALRSSREEFLRKLDGTA